MRKPLFSPVAFTVAFCCTYALVFTANWPLFIYYPLHGNLKWGYHVAKGLGPAMSWYGFMADSSGVALVVSLAVPKRWADPLFRDYIVIFPIGAMLVAVILLRSLFFS